MLEAFSFAVAISELKQILREKIEAKLAENGYLDDMCYAKLSRKLNFPFANTIAELSRTHKHTCNVRVYVISYKDLQIAAHMRRSVNMSKQYNLPLDKSGRHPCVVKQTCVLDETRELMENSTVSDGQRQTADARGLYST